ncbi:GDSL esterase/lipase [Wolffia australiana]
MQLPMEPWVSVVARAEDWVQLCEERIKSSLLKFGIGGGNGDDIRRRDDPINILKRLQREAFYEIMKLRERQEKLERTVTFYKTGRGSPFQDSGSSTCVKGIVSINGTFPFLNISGITTGVESRFIFETVTRDRDNLIAELVARQGTPSAQDINFIGSPLTLSKVTYLANINDSLSLVAIPVGAKCQDFDLASQPSLGPLLTSSLDPPLLYRSLGCAAGIGLKFSSNISGIAALSASNKFSYFGQVNFQFLEGAKVSLLGHRQDPRASSQQTQILQMSGLEPISGTQLEAEQCPSGSGSVDASLSPSGSAAMVLESELDESSRLRGWVELLKPNLRSSDKKLQWGCSLSDAPQEEMGWGLSIGGTTGDDQERCVQIEGFLHFCIGKRLTLQPGLVYTADGRTRSSGVVVSSRWTF